jgi:hypothetical protein
MSQFSRFFKRILQAEFIFWIVILLIAGIAYLIKSIS